ncbi:spinocerebellar ataxia type 10 protein domain-containing protein [Lactifluus subvellereus]|nr:spinocerebellar ataxia type 10 protein domain-containing protein [Lactifluus subvellereus]
MLTQTLSNLVTGNQELLDRFWAIHMQIPEEQSVLIRLLSLPDLRSVISVLVLIMNCIHDSEGRGHALVNTSIGVRVCVSILDRLQALLDHSESGDEGKVFELGYALFSKLFQFGFFPELYNRTPMQDELVSPTQTTLLKLLDSFLQPVPSFQGGVGDPRKLAGCLVSAFFSQAEHIQRAIQQAVGSALDVRLPGVCVALVLLSTSLSSILLAERENGENEGGASTDPSLVRLTLPCHDTISGPGNSTETGFIEVLIETLRLLDIFLPRINFGKVRSSNVHFPSDGGVVLGQSADATGFAYLKRDLVRLLGILCHNSRAIQDRVRRCGGIPIILNLCVIDERNPYLREHALFTLRNLLHNNAENQAVVDTFRADEHVGTVM